MHRFVKSGFVATALIVAAPVVSEAADAAPPAFRARAVPYYNWSGFYLGGHVGVASTDNENGILGGGQVGFNHQVGQWVFGVEGQLSGTSISEGAANLDWISTLAFRAGWAVDRWLVYGKIGAAWAGIGSETISARSRKSVDDTVSGWMLGVGAEYALQGNWSAKLEYNMLDFGNDLGNDATVHVFKAGLNYRFGFGPGVRAK